MLGTTASALIGGGAGIFGSAATGIFGARQAKKNRDFQERMANTSYQRAMQDMEKAGLNPMLVAKLGGAQTPPGAASQVDIGKGISEGASSAIALRRQNQELSNMRTQKSLMIEQAWLAAQQAKTEQTKQFFNAAGADLANNQGKKLQQEIWFRDLEKYSAQSMSAVDQSKVGGWLRAAKRVMDAVTPFRGK